MNLIKVVLIQFQASGNANDNLARMEGLVKRAYTSNPQMIVLPEMWSLFLPAKEGLKKYNETNDRHEEWVEKMSTWAREGNCYLVGGSVFAPSSEGRVFNRSYSIGT